MLFRSVHGYTDNARDWVPLVPYLSKRFHLILVDLRGHGRSSKPDCCYTLPDFAYDIVLLLDHLGVQKATLPPVTFTLEFKQSF